MLLGGAVQRLVFFCFSRSLDGVQAHIVLHFLSECMHIETLMIVKLCNIIRRQKFVLWAQIYISVANPTVCVAL